MSSSGHGQSVARSEADLEKAKEILDDEHYGLEKVKERILEYLAIRKLSKSLNEVDDYVDKHRRNLFSSRRNSNSDSVINYKNERKKIKLNFRIRDFQNTQYN